MTTFAEGRGGKGLRQKRLIRGATLAFAVPLAGWVGYGYLQLVRSAPSQPLVVAARGDLGEIERRAVDVFKQAAPSVVLVIGARDLSPLADHHGAKFSLASGFVWDGNGHLVTSDLVVKGVNRVRVRFADRRLRWATVLGSAPEYGLAVVRVEGATRSYRPVHIGTCKDLAVGQTVFAIGSPYGLSATLSQGLVGALRQRVPAYSGLAKRGVIQTDAVINPGNAGGPLLDSAGRLVGVNIAFVVAAGGRARVGFAVPVDVVTPVVSALIRAHSGP